MSDHKGAITGKIKLAIKHKTSPERLAQLLQPSGAWSENEFGAFIVIEPF